MLLNFPEVAPLLRRVLLYDDQFAFFDGIHLLNRFVLMIKDLVLTDEMDYDTCVWRQTKEIELIEAYHVKLIVVPDLLVKAGVEFQDKSSH